MGAFSNQSVINIIRAHVKRSTDREQPMGQPWPWGGATEGCSGGRRAKAVPGKYSARGQFDVHRVGCREREYSAEADYLRGFTVVLAPGPHIV